MFLVSNGFSIMAELDEFLFVFSTLSVIIFVETVKLHKEDDVVCFNHSLEHDSELSFVTTKEVKYRYE